MYIKKVDDSDRSQLVCFIKENWGSSIMVSRGKVHDISKLPGFIAYKNDKIIGLITYNIENKECEVVSLDSLEENKGLGSKLLEKVIETAKENRCHKVWLITTNDNTRAIRFYQKRDFDIKAIHIDAVNESRKIKPEIPLKGYDNISILHEIEFEIKLKD
ncbi:acetyltransferase [Gottschalkia purinilytica]|uniref:Acetyltransferase n=1 Tax=Gottschalkia purinilytica TaxID=1503 RepID=A0A0L0WBB3_GOTPU|nr:GNAT family N-acetyltransferase [Gottschalkia purinilytica]KNF08635.1 acetyltransferase [Gottschalkia purinilytica]